MIKPPSVLKSYTLIYSGDPALVLPPEPAEPDPTGAPSARARALELARDTGSWAQLLAPGGEAPTLFEMRPLPGTAFDWWAAECRRRDLSQREAFTLILRLALRKVENFGAHTVRVEDVDGQSLALPDIIDAIYAEAGAHGADIIDELAKIVIARARPAPRPLS